MILARDCQDEYRKQKRKQEKIIDGYQPSSPEEPTTKFIENLAEKDITEKTLTGIDKEIAEELQHYGHRIRNYIVQDPDNILKKCYTTNSECNCQTVLKLMWIESSLTLKEIGEKFGLTPYPPQKVQSIIKKSCCIKHVQNKVLELGYQPEV